MIAIRDPQNRRPPTPLHRARQLVAETLLPPTGSTRRAHLWANRFWIAGFVAVLAAVAAIVIWAVLR